MTQCHAMCIEESCAMRTAVNGSPSKPARSPAPRGACSCRMRLGAACGCGVAAGSSCVSSWGSASCGAASAWSKPATLHRCTSDVARILSHCIMQQGMAACTRQCIARHCDVVAKRTRCCRLLRSFGMCILLRRCTAPAGQQLPPALLSDWECAAWQLAGGRCMAGRSRGDASADGCMHGHVLL